MTEFISPQLAKPAPKNKPLTDPFWEDYILEPKHDGMRAVVFTDRQGNVQIQSRTDKPYALHVPNLANYLSKLPPDTVLDGELAVVETYANIEDRLVPVVDFNATMRIMGSNPDKAVSRQFPNPDGRLVSFILFDVLRYEGVDATSLTQTQRRLFFDNVLTVLSDPGFVILNPQYHSPVRFQAIYDTLIENGIEGAILKNKQATYLPGKRQNKAWYKFKTTGTADVVVTGFTDAKEGVTAKYLGQVGAIKFGAFLPDGTLQEVGQTSGFTDELRLFWTEVRDNTVKEGLQIPLHGGTSELFVIEIKYNDLVGTGEYRTPRHPQYLTIRHDKNPQDCLMEQFK